jgi:hypothetical protein
MVSSKTSQRLQATFGLSSSMDGNGTQVIDLTVDLLHAGTREEDPVYDGFQRWFIDVALPTGATLVSAPEQLDNPDASSGGSYLTELYPTQTERLNIVFAMPPSQRLLVRKQAGLTPPRLKVAGTGCATPAEAPLVVDTIVHWDGACASGVLAPTSQASSLAGWSLGGVLDVQARHRPRGRIDLPTPDQWATGELIVFGWAADPTAPHGTGVESVDVYLDGALQGQARYGQARPDVAAVLGSDEMLQSGFSFPLDLSTATPGQHTLAVVVRGTLTGSTATYRQAFRVVPGADLRGSLDLPRANSRVDGSSLTVWGWVADRAARTGTGVASVSVFLDGEAVGDARYGVHRPDVAAALGNARFSPSGYHLELDVRAVSVGHHTLRVVAHASGDGGTREETSTVEVVR